MYFRTSYASLPQRERLRCLKKKKTLYQEKLSGLSFEAKHVFLLSRADKRELSADKRDASADKRDRATSLSLQSEAAGAAGAVGP